jgi:uncharacterized protein involved in response to NO
LRFLLAPGFPTFFLVASIWAAAAIPLCLGAYAEGLALPTQLAPPIWHAHEMVFGYAAATVAGPIRSPGRHVSDIAERRS